MDINKRYKKASVIKKPRLLVISFLIVFFISHMVSGFVDEDVHRYVCQEHLRQIWGGTWPDQNYSNMTDCSMYPQEGFPDDFWIINVEKNPGKHYCSSYSCPAKDWANHWAKVAARWSDEYIGGGYENNEYLYRGMCAQCIADHFVADLQEGRSKEYVLERVINYDWDQNGSVTGFRSWNPTGRTSAQLREIARNVRKCEERMLAACDEEIQYVLEYAICNESGIDPLLTCDASGCPPCLCSDINPKKICPPCEAETLEVEVEKVVEVPQQCPKPPKCPERSEWTTSFILGIPFGAGLMATLIGVGCVLWFYLRKRNE